MNRRDLITAFAATAAITLAAPLPVMAGNMATMAYSPKALQAELAAGHTVFLDFKASWCSTCAAQERVINALRAENPAYDEGLVFMNVDWDEWGKSQIVKDLNIPRRSTLVVIRGNKELGRIVAGTATRDIKALMDRGLAG